eukprot:2624850-Rhodomonas_salina.1
MQRDFRYNFTLGRISHLRSHYRFAHLQCTVSGLGPGTAFATQPGPAARRKPGTVSGLGPETDLTATDRL